MPLNVTFISGMPYIPQIYGGIATNTHEMIGELKARGHAASVVARLAYGNTFGVRTLLKMRLKGNAVSNDSDLGYPVLRAREPWKILGAIARPDVAIVQDGRMIPVIEALRRLRIPTIAYLHGLEFEDWQQGRNPFVREDLPDIPYLANSQFTASRFRKRYGVDATIIRPVFRAGLYATDRKPKHVTFINPVADKGVEIALKVASACPDIPFLFVKGWPLSPKASVGLSRRLRSLPNVTLRERTRDMREIYRTTRILLVPSVWERETWGRVASEAHCSGIPVLGSNRGGLPEAIGPGGVIVPFDAEIGCWTKALRRLWTDRHWYEAASNAATRYAEREDLNTSSQVSLFISELMDTLAEPAA